MPWRVRNLRFRPAGPIPAGAGGALLGAQSHDVEQAHGAAGDAAVVAQLGQSLDGRIATVNGESLYINGEEGLDHLHRLRAAVDANMTWLAILGVIASVIGAYYYLRLVKVMYFDEPQPAFEKSDLGVRTVLLISALFVLVLSLVLRL